MMFNRSSIQANLKVKSQSRWICLLRTTILINFSAIVMCVALTGCGRSFYMHAPIDLAHSTQGAGSVLFECFGPELPTEIIGHFISVDEREPFFVENFSQLRVMVTDGRYSFTIVSLKAAKGYQHAQGSVPQKEQVLEFGKPATGSFYMIEGGAAVVRYHTPAVENESGQLWIM